MGNNSFNRRTVLKTAAAGGFASTVPARIGRADDTVEIVVAKTDGEPAITREVPRSWYQQLQRARRAIDDVRRKHWGQTGVVSIGLERSRSTTKGVTKQAISVRVDPDKFDGEMDESRRKVQINQYEEKNDGSELSRADDPDCLNAGDFDSMPGGVVMSSTYEPAGTSFSPVYDKRESETKMMTVAHLWEPGKIYGYDAEQSGRFFGEVDAYKTNHDWAIVDDQSSQISFDTQIRDDSQRYGVNGYITRDGADNLKSEGETFYSTGVATGAGSGKILETDYSYSLTFSDGQEYTTDGKGIKTDIEAAGGDSGGPVYRIVPEGVAYVLHPTSVGESGDVGNTDCNDYEDTVYAHRNGYASWAFIEDDMNGDYRFNINGK